MSNGAGSIETCNVEWDNSTNRFSGKHNDLSTWSISASSDLLVFSPNDSKGFRFNLNSNSGSLSWINETDYTGLHLELSDSSLWLNGANSSFSISPTGIGFQGESTILASFSIDGANISSGYYSIRGEQHKHVLDDINNYIAPDLSAFALLTGANFTGNLSVATLSSNYGAISINDDSGNYAIFAKAGTTCDSLLESFGPTPNTTLLGSTHGPIRIMAKNAGLVLGTMNEPRITISGGNSGHVQISNSLSIYGITDSDRLAVFLAGGRFAAGVSTFNNTVCNKLIIQSPEITIPKSVTAAMSYSIISSSGTEKEKLFQIGSFISAEFVSIINPNCKGAVFFQIYYGTIFIQEISLYLAQYTIGDSVGNNVKISIKLIKPSSNTISYDIRIDASPDSDEIYHRNYVNRSGTINTFSFHESMYDLTIHAALPYDNVDGDGPMIVTPIYYKEDA